MRFVHGDTMRDVRRFILVLTVLAGLTAQRIQAEDHKQKNQRDEPVFILNAASVERTLVDSDLLFRLIERKDLGLAAKASLSLATGGLRGIDRKRPFGVMTFIDPGSPPAAVAVYYVPVADRKELTGMLKAGGYLLKETDRLLKLRIGNGEWHLKFQGRYAFLARETLSLQREFDDPTTKLADNWRRYDASVHVRPQAMPSVLRQMVVDYFSAIVSDRIVQQPRENKTEYQHRQMIGNQTLSALRTGFEQCEDITVGLSLSARDTTATIDFCVTAHSGTSLSRSLKRIIVDADRNPVVHTRLQHFYIRNSWVQPVPTSGIQAMTRLLSARQEFGEHPLTGLANVLAAGTGVFTFWGVPQKGGRAAVVGFVEVRSQKNQTQSASSIVKAFGRRFPHDRHKTWKDKTGRSWHEFSPKAGGARNLRVSVVADGPRIWVSIAPRDTSRLLSRELQARRLNSANTRRTKDEKPILLLVSRWSVLQSLFADRSKVASSARGTQSKTKADRLTLQVTHRSDRLTVRMTFQSDLVSVFAKRFAGRLAKTARQQKVGN